MGGYLLATWIANGGLRPRVGGASSRFAPPLIFGHGGLAATGLVVWICYLVVSASALAWAALVDLVLVATLGATMFGLWIKAGHGAPRGRHAAGPRHAAEGRAAARAPDQPSDRLLAWTRGRLMQ
jgi:hypothetical protein